MSNALQILNHMADEAKARKYPSVKATYLLKSKYSDENTNALTACVIAYFTLKNGWATRIQSQGQFREDLKKWTPGTTKPGTADVHAVLEGQHFSVEIKHKTDRQSDAQREVQAAVEKAGGYYLIARTFEGFFNDLNAILSQTPF